MSHTIRAQGVNPNGILDRKKGLGRGGKKAQPDPYKWCKSTIAKILAQQEYCGDVINFKIYSISYKNQKRHENNPENMMVFKDIHEPIIERATFEKIQPMRKSTRKKPMKSGEHSLFSGLLKCADRCSGGSGANPKGCQRKLSTSKSIIKLQKRA